MTLIRDVSDTARWVAVYRAKLGAEEITRDIPNVSEEALKNLERATQLAPEDPLAFTSLSMCLQRLNRIADAETAQAKARMLSWKQELKTNPNAPPPSTYLAMLS